MAVQRQIANDSADFQIVVIPKGDGLPERVRIAEVLAGRAFGQNQATGVGQCGLRTAADKVELEDFEEFGIDKADALVELSIARPGEVFA